jgi:hypothetical protein
VAAALIDRYLLGEPVSKPDVVASLLANRTSAPEAEAFYRAFEAIGAQAADEAFVALRLVLAGRRPDDASVRRLRALGRVARACAMGDRAGLRSVLERDRAPLEDFPRDPDAAVATVGAAARAAYAREVAGNAPVTSVR